MLRILAATPSTGVSFVDTITAIGSLHCCGDTDAQLDEVRRILAYSDPSTPHDEPSALDMLVIHMLTDRGLLEHGTSASWSWRTPLGNAALAELTQPTACVRCGHPAWEHMEAAEITERDGRRWGPWFLSCVFHDGCEEFALPLPTT